MSKLNDYDETIDTILRPATQQEQIQKKQFMDDKERLADEQATTIEVTSQTNPSTYDKSTIDDDQHKAQTEHKTIEKPIMSARPDNVDGDYELVQMHLTPPPTPRLSPVPAITPELKACQDAPDVQKQFPHVTDSDISYDKLQMMEVEVMKKTFLLLYKELNEAKNELRDIRKELNETMKKHINLHEELLDTRKELQTTRDELHTVQKKATKTEYIYLKPASLDTCIYDYIYPSCYKKHYYLT